MMRLAAPTTRPEALSMLPILAAPPPQAADAASKRTLVSCLRLPLWRVSSACVLACALALALDYKVWWARLAWSVAWPLVAVFILAEALLLVHAMFDLGASPLTTHVHIGGLGGLMRLFDNWMAWGVAVGCCLMLFHLHSARLGDVDISTFDGIGIDAAARSINEAQQQALASIGGSSTGLHRHFSGFAALAPNASAFEALSYFVPFSILMQTGLGLVILEPTSAFARILMMVIGIFSYFFQVTIIFTGVPEALERIRMMRAARQRITATQC